MAKTTSTGSPPVRFTFDATFQEKIVRLLYQEEGFAATALDFITPDLFENPIHRWVVSKIRWSHNTLGNHITRTILKNEYKKAIDFKIIRSEERLAYKKFLADRMLRPVPDKSYIKEEVQRFVKNQKAKELTLWLAEEGIPKQNFEEMNKRMVDVVDLSITGDNSIGTFTAKTYKKRIKQREEEEANGITTGIAGIDQLMISEGVPPKQIAAVLAPTGRGKTNFLINVAASAVLEGIETVVYSLELEEKVMNTRFDSRFSGVPLKMLKGNPDQVEEGWAEVASKAADKLLVKEYPTGSLTVGMIKAHLRQLERYAFYPKLVIVDYADLMRPRVEFSDSSYETQGQVYVELRGLAMSHNVAIWTGTQGNRGSLSNEEGDVDLENMADSFKKAMICDVVVALCQSKKEEKENVMRALLAKNRNGPKGREVPISVQHDRCLFKDRR